MCWPLLKLLTGRSVDEVKRRMMCALEFLTGRPIGGMEGGMMVLATPRAPHRQAIDEVKRRRMCANTKYGGGHPNFSHHLSLLMISCDCTVTTSESPV